MMNPGQQQGIVGGAMGVPAPIPTQNPAPWKTDSLRQSMIYRLVEAFREGAMIAAGGVLPPDHPGNASWSKKAVDLEANICNKASSQNHYTEMVERCVNVVRTNATNNAAKLRAQQQAQMQQQMQQQQQQQQQMGGMEGGGGMQQGQMGAGMGMDVLGNQPQGVAGQQPDGDGQMVGGGLMAQQHVRTIFRGMKVRFPRKLLHLFESSPAISSISAI